MTNLYFNKAFDVVPGNLVRSQAIEDEFLRVEQGFDGVQTALGAKANAANGTHTGTTVMQSLQLSGNATSAEPTTSSQLTTKNYVDTLVTATAFSPALPGQTGNAGKFVTTNGTSASWAYAGIAQVTTATGNTTLTNAPTLLQITPTNFGASVTLPDATTCTLGGPLFCIDNRSPLYSVRVLNNSGTLLGFVPSNTDSYVSLNDKSTAAGVWSVSMLAPVGISAQLPSTAMAEPRACVPLDSDREFLLIRGVDSKMYATVYRKSTNAFSTLTVVRTSFSVGGLCVATLQATNAVLVVSCATSSSALEAVICSVNASTDVITVNTVATATLSANYNSTATGSIVTVGSSFVVQYNTVTPTNEIRAITVSGTTVTIGAATALAGTTGGFLLPTANGVLAAHIVPSAGQPIQFTYYGISGTTITAGGTALSAVSGTYAFSSNYFKFFPLGTRWAWVGNDNGLGSYVCGIISLSGTTPTNSGVSTSVTISGSTGVDAMVISSSKFIVMGNASSNQINIITDSAGTPSAGTVLNTTGMTGASFYYLIGNTAYAAVNMSGSNFTLSIDVSGASPVIGSYRPTVRGNGIAASSFSLKRSTTNLYGTNSVYMQTVQISSGYGPLTSGITEGLSMCLPPTDLDQQPQAGTIKGVSDNYNWGYYGANHGTSYYLVRKAECVV